MSVGSVVLRRGMASAPPAISNIMIFGGGLMGSGIAQVAAQTGHRAVIVDQNGDILKATHKRIVDSLSRVAKKQAVDDPAKYVDSIASRISIQVLPTSGDIEVASDTDLIIEAIVENLDIKHKLWTSLDKSAPKNTVFATNTSSLSVDDIFKVTARRDRVGGLHFFNPVPMMKLVEVIKGEDTSDATFTALYDFATKLGKTVVKCGDTPGFIVNRLLVPYMAEAARLVERGDASFQDVDTGMKLGAGHPMGPFELMDYVGLDTCLFILDGWAQRYPDQPNFKVPDSLRQLVREGKLGRKSGHGFYNYSKL